jgi:hypothetical protein
MVFGENPDTYVSIEHPNDVELEERPRSRQFLETLHDLLIGLHVVAQAVVAVLWNDKSERLKLPGLAKLAHEKAPG